MIFQPDENARRRELLFQHNWERLVFFGGLVVCLVVVLIGQYLWT